MRRYLLFGGAIYYPFGGWDDFVDSYDSVAESIAALGAGDRRYDWFHVVDSQTGNVEVFG